jgi:hypothetical protein
LKRTVWPTSSFDERRLAVVDVVGHLGHVQAAAQRAAERHADVAVAAADDVAVDSMPGLMSVTARSVRRGPRRTARARRRQRQLHNGARRRPPRRHRRDRRLQRQRLAR